jgi:hypothetical protein
LLRSALNLYILRWPRMNNTSDICHGIKGNKSLRNSKGGGTFAAVATAATQWLLPTVRPHRSGASVRQVQP